MSLAALVLLGVTCSALPTGPATELSLRKEVCYDELGCFSNSYPWTALQRPFPVLPEKPEKIGTRFLLYTRENPTTAEEFELLPNKPLMLKLSPFKATKKTTFIIHGFTQDSRADWFVDMTKELLKHEDMNVIGVDWKAGAGIPYIQASANTRVVAAEIVRMINFLIQYGDIFLERIHLIGHSIGAHAAGYVGQMQYGIGRISGLDPAQPYFNGVDRNVRLDQTDAKFVDVIHSDASSILLLGMGLYTRSGHVDFYPNGGKNQPGCSDSIWKVFTSLAELLTIDLDGTIAEFACSHLRSTYLYVESINQEQPFIGYTCKDWNKFEKKECLSTCQNKECSKMGYHADEVPQQGSFYLYTEDTAPFTTRVIKMEVKIANRQKTTSGKVLAVIVGVSGVSEEILMYSGKMDRADTLQNYIRVAAGGTSGIGDIRAVTLKYEHNLFQKKELTVAKVTVQELDNDIHVRRKEFHGATLHSGKTTFVNKQF